MKKPKSLYPACLAALLLCSFPQFSVWGGHSKSEVAAPKGWPRQLDTRKLYPSKCGFVYAAGDSAAVQVNKLIEAAIKQTQKDGVKTPKAGLVLVVDRDDKPPFSVEQLLTRLAQKQEQQKESQEPKKALEAVADGKKKFEELGLDMNMLLSITPMPIEPNMLPGLVSGFPAELAGQIGWCIAIPTEDNIRYGFKTLLDAGMKKEKIGFAKRVAMAPLLAIAEHKAIGELKKGRQDALCLLLAGKQIDFTGKQKQDKGQEHNQGCDESHQ
jgi:hypothetical protein